MPCDLDYVDYIAEQLEIEGMEGKVRYKKMFGEYMIYLNENPLVLVCDNTPYIKKLDCVKPLLENAEKGVPYKGAKEHYILDIENTALVWELVRILNEKAPPPPLKKPKRR